MEQIGEKNRFFRENSLKLIPYEERPEQIPPLGPDERIYAGVDHGNGEVMYLLQPGQDALDEAQRLWDFRKAGQCKSVAFYIG